MLGFGKVFGSVCVAAALTLCACGTGSDVSTPAPPGYTDVRTILQRLTSAGGAPGVLLAVRDARGRTVLTSGVANIETHAPIADDSRFRIGSMTKMFVATVVLQLVAERRVVLDAPVEQYLPGVISGNGNDGRDITVRQLLQHTSGLPDYLEYLSLGEVLTNPVAHHDPLELVQIALAHPRLFAPGTGWQYSSTNYVLAGMLIEQVTDRPYEQEIEQRVIGPLGLHDTFVPGDESAIPGTHPQGYAEPEGSLIDTTEVNPSIAGASGAMISSAADLDRFLDALVNGGLLRPSELQAMMTTHPTGSSSGSTYGLGLESSSLPCGGVYWGHDGGILGFQTLGGVTTDGRSVTVMANLYPGGSDAQAGPDMRTALTTALCASTPSKPKP